MVHLTAAAVCYKKREELVVLSSARRLGCRDNDVTLVDRGGQKSQGSHGSDLRRNELPRRDKNIWCSQWFSNCCCHAPLRRNENVHPPSRQHSLCAAFFYWNNFF
ncbi:hypothetical protein EYF80_064577 [Liparis tanakae]|uniref:Uncharacterized protein n=1 Tax=Liparis tanakae TaxID=230148 RepID=A0A4Z2E954_9TELE|nr:hypothetical protein EYF80_064577 [Liparis tanakae]